MKLKYTVMYETGNDFEPVDSYTETLEINPNMTNEEIKEFLSDEFKIANNYTKETGLKIWVANWEVYDE